MLHRRVAHLLIVVIMIKTINNISLILSIILPIIITYYLIFFNFNVANKLTSRHSEYHVTKEKNTR